MIREAVLKNGVRIVMERMENVRSVAISVACRAGSVYELPEEAGISHFVEHMVFKGTKKRSAGDIAKQMDAVGGSINAATSRESTRFYAKVLDEHLPIAVDVLSDMVLDPRFDEKDIELEKGVVFDEILMASDDPDDVAMQKLHALYYENDPLAKPVLGSKETVGTFTQDMLFSYMKRRYTPDNLIISCAGNFDYERLISEIEERFSGLSGTCGESPYFGVPSGISKFEAVERNELEQIHINLAFPGFGFKDSGRYPLMAFNCAFGGSMSSRLFQNIRESRGLAYSVGSTPSSYMNSGYFICYAATGIKQAETVLELMLSEVKKARSLGITKDELAHVKENLKGSLLLWYESTAARSAMLSRCALENLPPVSEADLIAQTENVTMDDIMQILPYVLDEKRLCATFAGRDSGLMVDMIRNKL